MSGKKSPNFTEVEKETLTDILNCNGRKEIIEDKHNNGKMIIKKENTWDEVVSAFNSCHGVNIRTKKQLKDAWKNMKSRLKAQAAAVKRDVRATGGGSSQTTGLDPISEKVLAMVPEQIYSLHNPYDDDATFHEEQESEVHDRSSACGTGTSVTPGSVHVSSSASSLTSAANKSPPTASSSSASASLKGNPKYSLFNIPKGKPQTVTAAEKPEGVKGRILQMAEEEHEQKMKVLKLKEDILLMKKRKLQQSIKPYTCDMCNAKKQKAVCSDDNNSPEQGIWQPYSID